MKRMERRSRHARETIAALQRMCGLDTSPADWALLHELHARHERELGRPGNAARAEARARRARGTD